VDKIEIIYRNNSASFLTDSCGTSMDFEHFKKALKEYKESFPVDEPVINFLADEKEEDWYKEQTKRWELLKKKGWKFDKIGAMKGFVSLGMNRFDIPCEGFAIQVPKTMSFKAIHTTILEACEEFSQKHL